LFEVIIAKVGTSCWRCVEAQQGHDLRVKLPNGHWQALRRHCEQSGETQSAVVRKALADYLDLDHHTLWQLSTSTAVVEGVFGGALQVKDLIDHGDFGLGTFEQLDGEGILLDGVCWQARADGSLIQAPPDEAIPFWVATHFQAERQMSVTDVGSIEDLGARIDPVRPGANLFVAIKIKGVFAQVEMRTVSRVPEGVGLLEASRNQAMV
jgi:acetolactate decarboxylase